MPSLSTTPDDLLAELTHLGVAHELRWHAPVTTVAEMMAVLGDMPGAHTKNLLLRDAKKTYFLVSMRHDAQLDMKALRPLIGARGNLSFASAEALLEKLGVTSGAVSPLAIINDAAHEVTVCLEDALLAGEHLNVHVLSNTATVSLTPDGLKTFLAAHRHPPVIFALPAASVDSAA